MSELQSYLRSLTWSPTPFLSRMKVLLKFGGPGDPSSHIKEASVSQGSLTRTEHEAPKMSRPDTRARVFLNVFSNLHFYCGKALVADRV